MRREGRNNSMLLIGAKLEAFVIFSAPHPVGITAQPAGAPPSPPLRLEQLEDKLYVLHGGNFGVGHSRFLSGGVDG